MFTIDKKQFGAFVAKLRKEKGLTQKALAEHLFLSDKAVSKWETGASLPDIAMLIPLAEVLGVSVTELLLCEKTAQNHVLETEQVEEIVRAAITYADEGTERAYQVKSKWIFFYGLALCIGSIGIVVNGEAGQPCFEALTTIMVLCAVFGVYFCCFAKTKLPAFYDENEVNMFCDGVFRMHMPGVRWNNSNWRHITEALRVSLCLCLLFFPVINFVMGSVMRDIWTVAGRFVLLMIFFCAYFIPVYLVGKK